jgi:hypothetical protein
VLQNDGDEVAYLGKHLDARRNRIQDFQLLRQLNRRILQELAQLAAAGEGLGEIADLLLRGSGIQAGRFRDFGKGACITWSGASH